MDDDLLPSSALGCIHTPKGMVQSVWGMLVPIYCPNCGAPMGHVPEKDMKDWFFLCNECVHVWGRMAAAMKMPFEVFIEKVMLEQIESYGRLLNDVELARALEAGDSPLATLINSSREGNT